MRNQVDQGMTYRSSTITLGDYLSTWLKNIKSSRRKSTWTKYEQVIRMYVTPFIGALVVYTVTPEQIQHLYNKLVENEIGIPTILKVHMVLHSAFQQAVKIGMVGRNPVSFTDPPKQIVKEMTILDQSQVSQFLSGVTGNCLEGLYRLALISGARQMELLALKWSDIDWTNQTIKIERQLCRPSMGHLEFSSPKTRYGKRTIPLGEQTLQILRSHYSHQLKERRNAGEKWTEHDLIFTNRNGGPLDHRNLVRDFKNLLVVSGLPEIRFHDLRHTAASIMLNNGIPAIVVSRRLGHAKPSITTDIYGHLIPGVQSEIGDKVDSLMYPTNCTQLHPTAPKSSSN